MRYLKILFILFLLQSNLYSQVVKYKSDLPVVYYRDSLQKAGEYKLSLQNHLSSLSKEFTCEALYKIAVNYAELNLKDSALYYLNLYVDHSSDDRLILADKAFEPLKDKKADWHKLEIKIKNSYLKSLPDNINENLALELFELSILQNLYEYYIDLLKMPNSAFETKNEMESSMFSNPRLKKETYTEQVLPNIMKSENIFKAILQKYGFPSVEKAGVFGENIAYKSIMKLNVSEQYLDSVENLFNKKLFDPLAYAMIKDKYLYMKDKKQEFGTLLYYCENDSKWELSLYPVSDFKI